jgi:dihydrodipicolinate reductase
MTIDTNRRHICVVCRSAFVSPSGTALTCSEACRRSDKWVQHKRDRNRKSARERRVASRAKTQS